MAAAEVVFCSRPYSKLRENIVQKTGVEYYQDAGINQDCASRESSVVATALNSLADIANQNIPSGYSHLSFRYRRYVLFRFISYIISI